MMRLMSFCATAMAAAKTAVTAPTQVTTWSAAGWDPALMSGNMRATRKTPAATIVAA